MNRNIFSEPEEQKPGLWGSTATRKVFARLESFARMLKKTVDLLVFFQGCPAGQFGYFQMVSKLFKWFQTFRTVSKQSGWLQNPLVGFKTVETFSDFPDSFKTVRKFLNVWNRPVGLETVLTFPDDLSFPNNFKTVQIFLDDFKIFQLVSNFLDGFKTVSIFPDD